MVRSEGDFGSKIDQKTHSGNQNQVQRAVTSFLAGETVGFCADAHAGPLGLSTLAGWLRRAQRSGAAGGGGQGSSRPQGMSTRSMLPGCSCDPSAGWAVPAPDCSPTASHRHRPRLLEALSLPRVRGPSLPTHPVTTAAPPWTSSGLSYRQIEKCLRRSADRGARPR